MRNIKYIVVHCTAASGHQKTQDIITYWRNTLGWKSNGYHWLISEDGSAERLTDDEKIANGHPGANVNGIHICYKGGWNGTDTRTEAQKKKLIELVSGYKKKYPTATVLGHRDLSPDLNGDGIIEKTEWIKLCPCFNAKEEYKNLK